MKPLAFLIDAGFAPDGVSLPAGAGQAISLVPESGEYARAVARLWAPTPGGPPGPGVPDEIPLHLYAYELLERMREIEAIGGKPATMVLPFWPDALFRATGLSKSGMLEIQSMYSTVPVRYYVRRPEAIILREARRVLGTLSLDATRYLRFMDSIVTGSGWESMEAS